MPILHGLPSVSAVAAEFLVASIWQGLVVVGCVALLLRVLPGLTAAVRSVIWTVVLLLVVVGRRCRLECVVVVRRWGVWGWCM